MSLDARLADLMASPIATWVLDPDAVAVVWANERALRLWNAESREELRQRQMTPLPPSIKDRLDAARQELSAGRSRVDDFVFYPKGVPTPAWLHFSALHDDDGRLLFLQQAVERTGFDAAQLRMTEAFNHSQISIAWVQFDGRVLLRNPAASATFGSADALWPDWIVDRARAIELLARSEHEVQVSAEVQVRTQQGERLHRVDLCRVRDAVSAQLIVLVQHSDQTARQLAEKQAQTQSQLAQELQAALDQIAEQHAQILELSAPLLEVAEGVVAVPLVGQLDAHRADRIAARILPALVERRARCLVLDLTGVAAFDAAGTQALLRIVSAVRLLGAQPSLCGISPSLARILVQSGLQTGDTENSRTLAEAVRTARERSGHGARARLSSARR